MYSHAEKAHPITKPTRPDPATVAAKKAEIKLRYRRNKKRKQPFAIASKRVAELRRLFKARYGKVLPDDDAGPTPSKPLGSRPPDVIIIPPFSHPRPQPLCGFRHWAQSVSTQTKSGGPQVGRWGLVDPCCAQSRRPKPVTNIVGRRSDRL